MARENQALQIALIIFVMLTIVLGVTTFLFFRQYKEEALRADANDAEAKAQRTAAENLVKDNNELKGFIGFAPTDGIGTVRDAFNDDMLNKYGGTIEETKHNYREMLQIYFDLSQQKNVSLAMEQEALQQMKDRNERLEASKDQQVQKYKEGMDSAVADLNKERAEFTKGREATSQQNTALHAKLEDQRKEATVAAEQKDQELASAKQQVEEISRLLETRNKTINNILNPTFEPPDGKISWVNHRQKKVWIDLGQADGVRRQMTFSVYAAETNDISQSVKKGSIEVTQVLDDLAEARIVEDEMSDPILVGDVVYTPVWAPGERLHFALTDGMDVDGDGKFEPDLVRRLITMNGAVIDAELDDEGNLTGRLTTNTRFLVLGKQHDAETPEALIQARVKLLDEADRLGIPTMTLAKLLRQMGWKHQTSVVWFGQGANPDDFPPRPPEGVPRVSRGNVSPLYLPDQPPRAQRRSAY